MRIHMVNTLVLKPQHPLFLGPTRQLSSLSYYLQTLCGGPMPDPLCGKRERHLRYWTTRCSSPWNEVRWACGSQCSITCCLAGLRQAVTDTPFQLFQIFPSLLPTGSLGKSWNPEQMGLSHLYAFGGTIFTSSRLSGFPTPIQPTKFSGFSISSRKSLLNIPTLYLTQRPYCLYHWLNSYSSKDVFSIRLSFQLSCKILSEVLAMWCVHSRVLPYSSWLTVFMY